MGAQKRIRTADRTVPHGMLTTPQHDELAREMFVLSLKGAIRTLGRGNRLLYEDHGEAAFEKTHGRPAETADDVASVMTPEPFYKMWSSLARSAQDEMWRAVGESIERERPRLEKLAAILRSRRKAGGSLTLDPTVALPEYIGHIDIHGQVGGYELNDDDLDVVAGAYYESGGNLYSRGVAIGKRDSKAGCLIAYLRDPLPKLNPKRILDMGCSAGSASVPYAEAFPSAEVHAIDVGAGMLRYAHARAESLGYPVHFSQRNAEATGFPDGHFDLIISHNMFHEVSKRGSKRVMAECHRLLSPGGYVFHQDIPAQNWRHEAFQQFMGDWQTWNNDEPCWRAYATMDAREALRRAGFAAEEIVIRDQPQLDGPGKWFIFGARKT